FRRIHAVEITQSQWPVLGRRAEHSPKASSKNPAESGAVWKSLLIDDLGSLLCAFRGKVNMHQPGGRLGVILLRRLGSAQSPTANSNFVCASPLLDELLYLRDVNPVHFF